jgi:hypothetical protein
LASLLVLLVLLTGCRRSYQSSPTAPRRSDAYEQATNPPPGSGVNTGWMSQVEHKLETNRLTLTFSSQPHTGVDQEGVQHETIRLNSGEAFRAHGVELALKYVAVAWSPPIAFPPADHGVRVPLRFFTPEGRVAPPEALTNITRYQRETSWEGNKPKLVLFFQQTGTGRMHLRPTGVFDQATKAALSTGWSYSQPRPKLPCQVEFALRTWHPVATEIIMDVEAGPTQSVELGLNSGMVVPLAGGHVALAGMWEGSPNTHSTSEYGGTNRVEMQWPTNSTKNHTLLLLLLDPPQFPVEIVCHDTEGKPITSHNFTSMAGLRGFNLAVPRNKIKHVTVFVAPQHYRVIWKLPIVPGLPPQAGPVNNLFEVRVPFLRLRDRYALREFISGATEMDLQEQMSVEYPDGTFPLLLTNTTPTEVLRFYARHLPEGATIRINSTNQVIEVRDGSQSSFWRDLRQKLGLR